MMLLHDLARMRSELAGRDVLSVYIAAEEHDPTERFSWRMRLDAGLDALQRSVAPGAMAGFMAARRQLEIELRAYRGFLPGRGWAAFVTADRVWYCAELPAPMPDLVRWRRGPVLGPYLRALKQSRPAVIALVDSRRARVLEYRIGELTETADLRADGFIDDLTDRNTSKRAATHSGVRGETGTDAADRILRQEADRMLKEVANRVREAGPDAFVILGGPTAAVAALRTLLHPDGGDRIVTEPALHLTISLPDMQPIVEGAVSALTSTLQMGAAAEVLDEVRPGGLGAAGIQQTVDACALGQVERLFLTPSFLSSDEDAAEDLIALTLEYGGDAELLSSAAAELLDAKCGGTAARLRFARRGGLASADASSLAAPARA